MMIVKTCSASQICVAYLHFY